METVNCSNVLRSLSVVSSTRARLVALVLLAAVSSFYPVHGQEAEDQLVCQRDEFAGCKLCEYTAPGVVCEAIICNIGEIYFECD